MHSCLYIPEILAAIFEYLLHEVRNYKQVLYRKHLLALVQTCRTFYQPALTLIWREIRDPAILILTMPEDLLELGTLKEYRTLRFKRRAVDSDWQRFDFHAHFVKEYVEGYEELDEIGTDCFLICPQICNELKRRGKALLPNLQLLRTTGSGLQYAYTLGGLTHTLDHLINDNIEHNHFMPFIPLINILTDLSPDAPHLRTLDIGEAEVKAAWNDDVFGQIHTSRLRGLNLEEFFCDWLSLTDEATQNLLSMPALRSLAIRKDTHALKRILDSQPMKIPQLTEFDIYCEIMNDGHNSLASVLTLLPSKLTTFRVSSEATIFNSSELSDLLRVMGIHCSPETLTSIIFEHTEGGLWTPIDGAGIVDFQMIKPLLPFSNLCRVCLTGQPFSLTDGEVKTLAMSWPQIRDIGFEIEGDTIPEPRTTLWGLLWFAIYCRKLQTLTFNFVDYADNKAMLPQAEIDRAAGHQLGFLSVGQSMIDDPQKVSSFLKSVFPELRLLNFEDNDHNRLWHHVMAQL